MSRASKKKALVVVNQVAYNTSYGVDFLRDGSEGSQVKVNRASELSVSPSSWEVEESGDDGGSCEYAHTESFTSSKGINYTLTTTCNPTRVTNKIKGKLYPTKIQLINRRPSNTTVGFAGVCTKKVWVS